MLGWCLRSSAATRKLLAEATEAWLRYHHSTSTGSHCEDHRYRVQTVANNLTKQAAECMPLQLYAVEETWLSYSLKAV